jgi:hypothetical protein
VQKLAEDWTESACQPAKYAKFFVWQRWVLRQPGMTLHKSASSCRMGLARTHEETGRTSVQGFAKDYFKIKA